MKHPIIKQLQCNISIELYAALEKEAKARNCSSVRKLAPIMLAEAVGMATKVEPDWLTWPTVKKASMEYCAECLGGGSCGGKSLLLELPDLTTGKLVRWMCPGRPEAPIAIGADEDIGVRFEELRAAGKRQGVILGGAGEAWPAPLDIPPPPDWFLLPPKEPPAPPEISDERHRYHSGGFGDMPGGTQMTSSTVSIEAKPYTCVPCATGGKHCGGVTVSIGGKLWNCICRKCEKRKSEPMEVANVVHQTEG